MTEYLPSLQAELCLFHFVCDALHCTQVEQLSAIQCGHCGETSHSILPGSTAQEQMLTCIRFYFMIPARNLSPQNRTAGAGLGYKRVQFPCWQLCPLCPTFAPAAELP